jgi:hypothetical protein
MESNNPVITLCIEGVWAELEDREEDARLHYRRAWDSRANDYEACLAAHYLARIQDSAEDMLHWNLKALELAFTADQEKVRDFYPSLYMSIAHTYKQLGGSVQAQRYYRLAAGLGEIIPVESDGEMVRWLKVFDWVQPMVKEMFGF